MNTDIAKMVTLVVTVNVAAMFLVVILSFVGSVWALEWLEKLDTWLRREHDKW
jgi:hypothetical protein